MTMLGMASSRRTALLCAAVSAVGVHVSAAPRRAHRTTRVAHRTTAAAPALPAIILPPEPSNRDRQVAEACQRALGPNAGAVVAMDPRTGRVVALVNPSYGMMKAFQPCSVFKVVVAIAGLSEGVITPDATIACTRGCWMWSGHGPIDLRRALAVSCNPYFERVGEQLGYAKIQRYAQLLGLGAPSGINLTGEAKGKLPQGCRPQDVGHLSSHAAGISTSAVQLAVLLSSTVNGGIVYQPQVGPTTGFTPKERWRLPPGTVLKGLAEGFVSAVNEGSASNAFDPDVIVAGKTGSCSRLGWFASYAPADQPELVIVVFLRWGNGHEASTVAGRIYQDLFKPATTTAAAPAAGMF